MIAPEECQCICEVAPCLNEGTNWPDVVFYLGAIALLIFFAIKTGIHNDRLD